MKIFVPFLVLGLMGCTTIQVLTQPPTDKTIGVDIAQLEGAVKTLDQSILSLVHAGYIKKDSSAAKTISVVLAGVNLSLGQAEKDYVAGDVSSAILAFNTAKAGYDGVQNQLSIIKAAK